MRWYVPGDSMAQTFATREEALARAWQITPAGGKRPEPVQDVDTGAAVTRPRKVGSGDSRTHVTLEWEKEDEWEVVSHSGATIATYHRAETPTAVIQLELEWKHGESQEEMRRKAELELGREALARGLRVLDGGVHVEFQLRDSRVHVHATARARALEE